MLGSFSSLSCLFEASDSTNVENISLILVFSWTEDIFKNFGPKNKTRRVQPELNAMKMLHGPLENMILYNRV